MRVHAEFLMSPYRSASPTSHTSIGYSVPTSERRRVSCTPRAASPLLRIEHEGLSLNVIARVLSGLAPPPLADECSVGYRAASHEGGGRGCGAWNADRKPCRSGRSALPRVTAGSAAGHAASSSMSAPAPC